MRRVDEGGLYPPWKCPARLRDQEDHQETDPPVAAFGCFSLGPICDTPQWIGTTRLNYICMALGMIIAVLAESRPVLVKHPESVQSETETRLSENVSESTMRPRPLKRGLESSLEYYNTSVHVCQLHGIISPPAWLHNDLEVMSCQEALDNHLRNNEREIDSGSRVLYRTRKGLFFLFIFAALRAACWTGPNGRRPRPQRWWWCPQKKKNHLNCTAAVSRKVFK